MNSGSFGRIVRLTIHVCPASRATGLGTTVVHLGGKSTSTTGPCLSETNSSGRTSTTEGTCRVVVVRWGRGRVVDGVGAVRL